MIRYLLLWMVPAAAALAQPAACPQFFQDGRPPALLNARLAARTTLLCNGAYAVLASGVTRGALWSAEHLTRDGVAAARDTPRQGEFHPEERLPVADRAELSDYRRSGYDRGHMSPSGDMPDEAAQQESFSLANMVPQAGELNRGVWADIEGAVRGLATRRGDAYVVTGPAFTGSTLSTVGADGLLVPSSVWKAVFLPASGPGQGSTGAYVCTNTDTPRCRVVSVAVLARFAGIDPFPGVPAGVKAVAAALPVPDGGGHGRHRRGRAGQGGG